MSKNPRFLLSRVRDCEKFLPKDVAVRDFFFGFRSGAFEVCDLVGREAASWDLKWSLISVARCRRGVVLPFQCQFVETNPSGNRTSRFFFLSSLHPDAVSVYWTRYIVILYIRFKNITVVYVFMLWPRQNSTTYTRAYSRVEL